MLYHDFRNYFKQTLFILFALKGQISNFLEKEIVTLKVLNLVLLLMNFRRLNKYLIVN